MSLTPIHGQLITHSNNTIELVPEQPTESNSNSNSNGDNGGGDGDGRISSSSGRPGADGTTHSRKRCLVGSALTLSGIINVLSQVQHTPSHTRNVLICALYCRRASLTLKSSIAELCVSPICPITLQLSYSPMTPRPASKRRLIVSVVVCATFFFCSWLSCSNYLLYSTLYNIPLSPPISSMLRMSRWITL